MNASVIISTYNSPEWLKKVLWGYNFQDYKDFELIIADDGSTQETKDLIEELRPQLFYPIQHVWHEDKGFRKSEILNKAISASKTDYLIFSDGDCVPRKDFVRAHVSKRKKNMFLSGGYLKLPMSTSKLISLEDIKEQRCFNLSWLLKNGMKFNRKFIRFLATPWHIDSFMDFTATTVPSWNGHSASGWKSDILSVNGFDERMAWGGQDREMGERMWNKGVRSKTIRYSAICIHLDHSRSYATKKSIKDNFDIWTETRNKKSNWTDFGVEKPNTLNS